MGSVRTINTAEVTYASTYPDLGFALLGPLGGAGGTSTGAGLMDSVLASGTKSGYTFGVTTAGATPATTYSVNADPQNAQTGQRHFFSDQSGVIRCDVTSAIAGSGAACPTTASPLQ